MILPEAAPDRLGFVQRAGAALARRLRFLPDLSVANTAIGQAMIQATLERRREGVVENREIRSLAARYQATRP